MGEVELEGLSAIGDRGTSCSAMPDADGMHVCTFESLVTRRSVGKELTVINVNNKNNILTLSEVGTLHFAFYVLGLEGHGPRGPMT